MSVRVHPHEVRVLLVGKLASALLGVAVLALVWRQIPAQAYGQLLTGLALVDVIWLVSSLGLSTITQRHLPIWLAHSTRTAAVVRQVAQVLSLRLALNLLLCLGLGLAVGLLASDAGHTAQATVRQAGLAGVGVVLIFGFLQRSLEELLNALRMQTGIQVLTLFAHALRLMALWLLDWSAEPTRALQQLILLEAGVSTATVTIGLMALSLQLRSPQIRDEALRGEAPTGWVQAWRQSLRFWVVQCLGLAWSLQGLRLLLGALTGPTAVAVHGAAQSMVDLLRQASPMVWMGGWLRATMLRLHATEPQGPAALDLAQSVHRTSSLLMWPILAAWCLEPELWFRWAAGTTWFDQAQELSLVYSHAPSVTAILLGLVLLPPLQNRHLLLTLWAQTRQHAGPSLQASMLALSGVVVAGLSAPILGPWSLPLGMVWAEGVWVGVAGRHRAVSPPGTALAPNARVRMLRDAAVPVVALGAAAVATTTLTLSGVTETWVRLTMPIVLSAWAIGLAIQHPICADARSSLARAWMIAGPHARSKS